MGTLSNRLALLIQTMKQSDERLESLNTEFREMTAEYILKTSKQLEEMDDLLKD